MHLPVLRRPRAVTAALLATILGSAAASAQEVTEKDLGKPTNVVKDGFERAILGTELADGRLLFVDAGGERGTATAYTRIDFATGKVERVLSSGPAEHQFRALASPLRWPGDSLASADAGKARLMILGPDGSYARSIKLGEPPAAPADAAPRGLRLPTARYAAGGTTLFGVGFAPRPTGVNPVLAPPRQLFPVVRFSIASLSYDTVVQLLPAQAARPPQRSQETATMMVTIPTTPFQAVDTWVAYRDGTVAVVRAATYRLDFIAPDGARTQGQPIPFPKVAVNDEDRKAHVSTVKRTTEENMGRASARSPIRTFIYTEPATWPATHPAFRGDAPAVLGSDERIWLSVRCENDSKATCFDVIDRTGQRAARYRLPARSRLLAAGKEAVYIVNESKGDDLTIERFALR